MIPYTYESLFLTDSTEKQMTITDGDEIILTNAEIHQEQFELHESLCSNNNLDFGACESSYIKFTTSHLNPLKNKVLTVSEVLTTHTEDPFIFGTYKVVDDKLTADRTKREVTAYDSLYEVINADVLDWYNTILPDSETTVTLKQFRDSFFSHFGITQETTTLPNDNETISKTIITNSLSGKDVLHAICEMNGCFGRINRENKFEYVYVYGKKGLYPSQTLFPSNKIYPSIGGGRDPYEVGENGTYISCTFEDYVVQRITKLVIKGTENDVGVSVGSGDNVYTIVGNFLLYDTENLETIAQKIYAKIAGVYYRPCELDAIGNPCLEVGDSILVETRDRNVFSLIMQRTLRGVQALKDTYIATGDEKRDEGLNLFNEQIVRIKGKTNTLERTLDHTISELTDFEEETQSTLSQYSDRIDAKVSKNSPTGQTSFSWEMTDTQMEWKANSNSIMKLNTDGLELSGKITATSGYIGNGANGFTINSSAIYNGMTSLADTTHNGIYVGTDGMALGKGNFKVDSSGNLTSSNATITGGSIELTATGSETVANAKFLITKNGNMSNGYFWAGPEQIHLVEAENANPKHYLMYKHSGGFSVHNEVNFTGDFDFHATGYASYMNGSNNKRYTQLTGDYVWLSGYTQVYGNLEVGSSYKLQARNIVYSTTDTASTIAIDVYGITLGQSGKKVGFFGSAGASKQAIVKMTSFTENGTVTKINEIIDALKNYGLISAL